MANIFKARISEGDVARFCSS